jgi:hypothetical protein
MPPREGEASSSKGLWASPPVRKSAKRPSSERIDHPCLQRHPDDRSKRLLVVHNENNTAREDQVQPEEQKTGD